MRNIKSIVAVAAAVPVLAPGGGIAYASTGGGTSPGTPAPATVTAVHTYAQPASQARHHNGQPGHDRINCDDRDHSRQQARTGTQLTSTQCAGHQDNHGTGQHRDQQSTGWGTGSGYHRDGSCGWGC